MVGLAQLVRAMGCGPIGQGFESLSSPQVNFGLQTLFFYYLRKELSPIQDLAFRRQCVVLCALFN